MRVNVFLLLVPIAVSACTPTPTVAESRDRMWAQYNHQSVDALLLAFGPPVRESRLTDGSRLLTYEFNSIYDYGSPYERKSGCEATFMAKAPKYLLENIAMQGVPYECKMLADGNTGSARHDYLPPPTPYVPGPLPSFYHHGF